jgi:hypothetical protein
MLPGIELGPAGFKDVDGRLLHAASVRAPTRIVGNNGEFIGVSPLLLARYVFSFLLRRPAR